ncbi:MAG: hypothetical protein JOZ49_01125 [Mycolicibacterium sp.]|nr:hypothetical protein [Mycolicibacterium sp.]
MTAHSRMLAAARGPDLPGEVSGDAHHQRDQCGQKREGGQNYVLITGMGASSNDATLAQVRSTFGKIGSATVGAALVDTLQARHEAAQRLGDYAARVAGHIHRNLNDCRTTEQRNAGRLKDTGGNRGGEGGGAIGVQAVSNRTGGAVPLSPAADTNPPLPPIPIRR